MVRQRETGCGSGSNIRGSGRCSFARDWVVDERWPLHRIAAAQNFRRQYWQLVRRAGSGRLVFCPVGRFIEFYGPQRMMAEQVLGLRRARLRRGGFRFGVGFPAWLWQRYAGRALSQGCTVLDVQQGRPLAAGESGRRVRGLLFMPNSTCGIADA